MEHSPTTERPNKVEAPPPPNARPVPPRPLPRAMPTPAHPFLVDQTKYLSRRASTASFRSTASSSSSVSRSSAGHPASYSTPSTFSAGNSPNSSIPLDPTWPFTSRPCTSSSRVSAPLGAAAPIFSRTCRHTDEPPPVPPKTASVISSVSSASSVATAPNTPSPEHSPPSPIDRRCLTWMRDAENQEYYFGSVANRSAVTMTVEERGVRREILPDLQAVESVEVLDEESSPLGGKCNIKARLCQRF